MRQISLGKAIQWFWYQWKLNNRCACCQIYSEPELYGLFENNHVCIFYGRGQHSIARRF